jgi:SagB-type dehydrogenase family enzyme
MLYDPGDVARLYHLNSSVSRSMVADPLDAADAEGPRAFPEAARVALPEPDFEVGLPLGEALRRRCSGREYHLCPLPLATAGRLLAASCSVRRAPGQSPGWSAGRAAGRPAPSAGGLYPLEVYLVAQQVEGLEDGLYHYDPWRHDLALLRPGALVPALAELCFGQTFLAQANLLVSLTAVLGRSLWKYGERAYRYALLEAGHVGQNLLLTAEALGMPALAVGGFFDAEVNRLLDLPEGQEQTLYHVAVGQPPRDGETGGTSPR